MLFIVHEQCALGFVGLFVLVLVFFLLKALVF